MRIVQKIHTKFKQLVTSTIKNNKIHTIVNKYYSANKK